MSDKNTYPEKTPQQLKEFGQVMTIACLVACFICYWKLSSVAVPFAALGLVFYTLGILAPKTLRVPEKYWMIMAEKMSVVMTFLITSLIFFAFVTPMSLIFRLIGKRLIDTDYDEQAKSYWVPVAPDGPASRPATPY